jgi:hypothetical protein
MPINREDVLRRQALQERAALLNETSPDALEGVFNTDDVLTVNAYQWETMDRDWSRMRHPSESPDPDSLIKQPLPKNFTERYGDRTLMFTHNKTMYDDDLEDVLFEDEIIATLFPKRNGQNPERNAAVMEAMRARRTTIAFLRHVGHSATRPEVTPPPAPAPPARAPQQRAA